MITKNLLLYFILFAVGGVGYSVLEIMWRGYTHWTMAITGGACLSLIFFMNSEIDTSSLILKCIIGGLIITAIEFTVGYIVNLHLKWNVWDYSSMPLNFKGQICLTYSLLWFFVCIPVVSLCEVVRQRLV